MRCQAVIHCDSYINQEAGTLEHSGKAWLISSMLLVCTLVHVGLDAWPVSRSRAAAKPDVKAFQHAHDTGRFDFERVPGPIIAMRHRL